MAKEELRKSRRSAYVSYVTFVNRHFREATVYWHNYEGQLIKYDTLGPNGTYGVKTYVEHPWSAKDTLTGDKLLIDNQSDVESVFYPRPNPSKHENVYIDTPKGMRQR